jgi:hypothetical protein
MIKAKKYDGVIEAVRYTPEGQIDWVRAYERRGFVFTDWLKLNRQALKERLQNGARFYIGRRKAYYGNDFDITEVVLLVGDENNEIIVAGNAQSEKDYLAETPII